MRQRWVILAATLCAGCWSAVSALGMGDIDVNSRLNQPFSASIPLNSLSADEAEGLQVRVAPSREFERAGVERKDYLSSLKFEIVGEKTPYIRITSNQVAKEPFLNLLIEARSGGARVVREYTVLLDPPGMASAKPAAASTPAAATSVAATPEASRAAASASSSSAAPASSETTQSSSRTYGPVRDAETFWSIATALRPSPAVSMDQTLLALYDANRSAFLSFNGLMRGVTLRVPSAEEMLEVSPTDAKARVAALRAGRRLPPRTASATSAAKESAAAKAKTAPAIAADKLAPAANAAKSSAAPTSTKPDTSAAAEPASKAKPAPQAPAVVAPSPTAPAKSAAPVAPVAPVASVAPSAVEPVTPAASSAASSSAAPSSATPSAASSAPEAAATPLAASSAEVTTPEATSASAESATPLAASSEASAPLTRESDLPSAAEAPAAPLQRETALPQSQSFWAGWLSDPFNFWVLVILALIGLLLLFLVFRRRTDDDDAMPRRPVYGVPPAAVAAASGSAAAVAPIVIAAAPKTAPVEDAAAGVPAPEADLAVAAEVLADEPADAAPHTPPTAEPVSVPDLPLEPALAAAAAYGWSQEQAQSQDAAGNSEEADLHLAYGLHDEAIASLKAALAEDPYRRDLRVKLAETYFAAGKPQEFHEVAEWLQPRLPAAEWAPIAAMGRQLSPEAALFQDMQHVELAGFDAPAAETQPILSSAPQGNYSEPLELGYGTQPLPSDDPFDAVPPFQPAQAFEPAPEFQAEPSFETATSEPAPETIELELPVESPIEPAPSFEPTPHVEPQSPFDAAPAFEPALFVEPTPAPQAEPASEVLEFKPDELQLGPAPIAPPEPEPQPHAGNTVDFDLSEFDLSLETPAAQPAAQPAPQPAPGNAVNFDLSQFDQPSNQPDLNDLGSYELRPEDYELELPESEFASDDEAGTKLDLARAYLDMGDNEMARSLLDEVSYQGSYQQKADAQSLLQRLPPL